MFRIYKGVVRNGVIVLEGDGQLPEGTKVTVLVEEVEETAFETNWKRLSEIVGAFDSGVSDVSERKHEYLAEAYERCGRTDKK
ncbi:MAG: hypothetical protein N3B10_06330 [Armatimonadetes bacterium]|nr:hypothetical protein [Armatimonadota bacterium]MCX7968094.1 hypothetical protein [Armatimonadota bacterium]MDW8144397.1 hypothetical protein [Armatimonadota bacterium]